MTDETEILRLGTRAADAVVRELEARIVSGALPDGAHLPPERDLIDTYGVSRTVVREAVAQLASRGLVESRPRYRPVVRRPGADAALAAAGGVVGHLLRESGGVKNLYDTRILIEGALVRHAALQARKADIAALARALAENEAAVPDSERFYATDVAFHAVLYDIPRNPILPAVHKAFTAWLAEHWTKMPRSPERNRVNWLRHRDIFTAIQDRDPDAAEAALTSHLNAAWEYVRGTFEGL
ncbi:FCD domain-containing protein [Rubellimicrobium arenae]|uniref:FCD domain-containing protein n=1 Tax=Rubellimicrobium arenae TaxID=2817372 RepID=UPI001B30EC2C|nr:FCD domain-containing protein [Rubellimicrobium arenae]